VIDILAVALVDAALAHQLAPSVITQGAVVLLFFGTLILAVLFFVVAGHDHSEGVLPLKMLVTNVFTRATQPNLDSR